MLSKTKRLIAALVLASMLAVSPVTSALAGTAIPPVPPGAEIPGLEEINLALGIIKAVAGKDCVDLSEAGGDTANYLLGKLFSKLHPVAAGLWFAKEFGDWSGTKWNEAVVEAGFNQFRMNRESFMRLKGLDPSKPMPESQWNQFISAMDDVSAAQPAFERALSYVNRGNTTSFRSLNSQERHFGMAMMEFMNMDKVWRDQNLSTWDSIGNWFSDLIYDDPLPYSFDQFNGTCKKKNGVRVVASWDPNAIEASPAGAGASNWIPAGQRIKYTVFFENEAGKFGEFMVPAEDVLVKLQLDADLNPATVEFGETSHSETASVEVALDPYTGLINWLLRGINLPPNNNAPEGEGWVTFYASPKANLVSGTEIVSQAEIVFDFNPPIVTDPILQTIDGTPPTVSMTSVASVQRPGAVELSWAGQDNAGIVKYVLYGSRDGNPLAPWAETDESGMLVSVEDGHTYGFAVEALDYVGLSSGVPASESVSFQVRAVENTVPVDEDEEAPAPREYILTDQSLLISLPGGGTLSIPRGFLPSGTRLRVTEISVPALILDRVKESTWSSGEGKRLILLEADTTSERPDIPGVISLVLESGTGLYRFDSAYGRLVPVAVDAKLPFMEAKVISLSSYVVLEETTPSFEDVNPDHWGKSFIELLARKGIIEGFEDSKFHPDESLTREQAAKMLDLAAGVPGSYRLPELPFADAQDRWSEVFVSAAVGAGILEGYPEGDFRPSQPVSRAEYVTMVVRAMGIEPGDVTGFADAEGHWAEPYLAAAVNQGLLSGYPDGTLRPNAPVTRAEAGKLLVLAFWQQ